MKPQSLYLSHLEEIRPKIVRQHVDSLLAPDGTCHPFTPENFIEAVDNIPHETLEGFLLHLTKGDAATACASLRVAVTEYWEKTATEIAERDAPSIGELLEDAKAEYAEIQESLRRENGKPF